MLKKASVIIAMSGSCLHLMAQGADSISLRPSLGADLSSEVQTDFELARVANLLQLHADIPLSKNLSVQVGSLSTLSTDKELEVDDIQGFSNIDTYDLNIPFALTVAGRSPWCKRRDSLHVPKKLEEKE